MATNFPGLEFESDIAANSVFVTVKDPVGGDNADKVYEALALKLCPTGAMFDHKPTTGTETFRVFVPWHNIEQVSQQLAIRPV